MTDSITVFRGGPATNIYTWSPFVTKLEARLRFANVSYKLGVGGPQSAPKGKIPYIQVGDKTTGDSTMIIKDLTAAGTLPDLNAKLSRADRAQDLALRALLEEKLYFYGAREKWKDNYEAMCAGVLAAVPWPLRIVIGWVAHSSNMRTLYGQGTGRLTEEELSTLRGEIWEGINDLLQEAKKQAAAATHESGEKPVPFWVLGGGEPTEADASLFGFIVGQLVCTA